MEHAMNRHPMKGRTVVITGASSGIGRGAAIELSSRGANVVLAARRVEVLRELAGELVATGGCALAVQTDVGDPHAVAHLRDAAVSRFGGIDVWINDAGIGALGFFWEIPVEDHARVVDVNFKGLLHGCHAALGAFIAQGHGTLINIGSIDSEVPLAFQSSYAASKAAVLSLGRTLNEELRLAGRNGIKVGTVMPWAVDTPWWTHAANYTGRRPRMAAMGDPSLVVDAIVRACVEPREEQPVGPKARASNLSHHVFPDLTERLSANLADRESRKAWPAPPTSGSLHEPMAEGTNVGGGIRERMEKEDAAPRARSRP